MLKIKGKEIFTVFTLKMFVYRFPIYKRGLQANQSMAPRESNTRIQIDKDEHIHSRIH